MQAKDTTDIIKFLDEMILYTENIKEMKENLRRCDYRLIDICPEIKKFNNVDISVLKEMLQYIMESRDQYYKFPIMFLIHFLRKNEKLRNSLRYDDFYRMISNYFLYTVAFFNLDVKKTKTIIQREIIEELRTADNFRHIYEKIQNMRKETMRKMKLPNVFRKDMTKAIYSCMDNFKQQDNKISFIYNYDQRYGDEHFVINDNNVIEWASGSENKVIFRLKLSNISDINKEIRRWKTSWVNHLLIPNELNGKMRSYDIVTKIDMLEKHYKGKLPKHISVIIDFVKRMEQYRKLKELKLSESTNESKMQKIYVDFLKGYFDNMAQVELTKQLEAELKSL